MCARSSRALCLRCPWGYLVSENRQRGHGVGEPPKTPALAGRRPQPGSHLSWSHLSWSQPLPLLGPKAQQPSTPAFKKQQERYPATSSLGSLCSQLYERTCGNRGEEVWRWNISIILKGDFAL